MVWKEKQNVAYKRIQLKMLTKQEAMQNTISMYHINKNELLQRKSNTGEFLFKLLAIN